MISIENNSSTLLEKPPNPRLHRNRVPIKQAIGRGNDHH